MALKRATEVMGIAVPEAYSRIDCITTHRAGVTTPDMENYHSVDVFTYRDQSAYEAGAGTINRECLRKDYDPAATVSFADFYDWLKTQPGFETSEDV